MKKGIIVMLISALFYASCTKETTTTDAASEEITLASAPASLVSYLDENYPDAGILSITKSQSGTQTYQVTLDTYEEILFDRNGNALYESKGESLCDSTGNHHGRGHHGRGHHGHGGGQELDSIPASIQEYVAVNYIGYTIHNARYDSLCQFGIVINVMIDSTREQHHKLIFDASGLFLALAHRVDSTEIPASVLNTITTQFPGYVLRKKAEQLTLADGSVQYRIFMHQEGDRKSVVILADGTLLCEL